MAHSIGITNPFLRPPGPGAGEVSARGVIYGRKIRGGADPAAAGIYWAYGRKTWANAGGLTFPKGKEHITTGGDISLYKPKSHTPTLPILTGVDTSNEGAMGSVIKASISFTIYPALTASGFELGFGGSFFKPGANIGVSFGWTTWASSACASKFGFNGMVLDFSWSVNTDVSINASTSLLAQGVIATGVTGNLSKKSADTTPASTSTGPSGGASASTPTTPNDPPFAPLDAKQLKAVGADLGTAIDQAMAQLNPLPSAGSGGAAGSVMGSLTPGTGAPEEIYGIQAWEVKGETSIAGLRYCSVGIPWQPDPPETDEVNKFDEAAVAAVGGSSGSAGSSGTQQPSGGSAGSSGQITKPIVKKFWYVNFGSMEDFLKTLIVSATQGAVKGVDIKNKTTPGGPGLAGYMSAYPMEVLWPGCDYGSGSPGVSVNGSPIGSIWFNCDYVKETWRQFFNDNNDGNANQKNLTSFLNELCKRANEAAGDWWQLATQVIEKFPSCGGVGKVQSVLSVEDMSYCEPQGGFGFNASFGKPMLKNVSISCKTSSTMGAAIMGGGNVDTPGKPGASHGTDPAGAMDNLLDQLEQNGVNTTWGDSMKGCLKLKKKADSGHHSKQRILFPIDFSVTIDGCSGWGFNEAINTNLKPPGYGGSVFAINGINNKIDVNTWETSLKGIMRLG